MAAFASGWNVIVRKKTLEDNNYNLRKVVDIPGTGPFKSKRRVENEVWVMEKNAELLEQGPALSRRHRVLSRAAVLARARLGDPVQPRRLRPHRRSGDGAQGQGDAGHVVDQLLPERHPGHLGQQQEEAARRSAGAARAASGVRPAGAGRRGQGRGADDGRRLHLPVLRIRHAEGRARQAARLPGRSDRGDQGGQGAAGRRRPGGRHQGPRLPGPRGRHLQAVGAGHPGHAAAGAQHRDQPAHRGRIRSGSTTSRPAISTWRSAPSCRRCSTRRTTSMPGTRRTGRRTTASGTTRSSTRCCRRSTARSTRPSAWP